MDGLIVHRHHIDLPFDTRRLFGLMTAFRGLIRGPIAANASQAASLVAHLALFFMLPFLYQRFLFDGMAAMIGPAIF